MSTFWPFVVIGLFTGSIYGLGALGLVLTYKTTGVFNFAYGAVAMFCAYFYWQLHDQWHVTAWIAVPVLLVALAPVIGLVFETLFRPLAGLSAEVPLVVSLAMLAVLQALANVFWKGSAHGLQPVIPRSTFRLGSHLYVGYDQLGTLLAALAMGGGLWWLLRHTRFGTATRAVVDNRDLSAMIGVNGDRVRQAAWIISSMSAGLVGVLLSPSQGIDPNNLVLVIIASFTPAVIGRLVSFPWAFVSALGMGVFASILTKWSSSGVLANVEASIPWLVLFVALITLGGKLKEAGIAVRPMAASAVTNSAPSPGSQHADATADTTARGVSLLDRAAVAGLVLFAVAVLLPIGLHGPKLSDLTAGVIFTMIAVTVVVLTGWAGQISIAQFSFVGVGAFCVGHFAGAHGQNFLWATLAGMAISVPLGLLVGLPALRLKGLFLALATFAFALIMDNVVFNSVGVSGGITGINDPRPRIFGVSFASTTAMYELAVVVLGIVLGGAYLLSLGPVGRRLRILRDSPLAASTLGVNLTVTKLVTFAVCGVVAAMAGALFGAWQGSITPFDFQWSWSLQVLLLVVFGGRARLTGAVIAGAVYTIITVHLFPIPGWVEPYIQLGVALGVVGLGRNPEGTVAISVAETRRTTSVLRRRPSRALSFGALNGQPNGYGNGYGNGHRRDVVPELQPTSVAEVRGGV
jgi:ABC-type branched-subunit amino acid transport system permease subunit